MENTKLEIRKVDIDNLVIQSSKLVGLAKVFGIFIAHEEKEDFLPGAFNCLTDLAFKLHEDCENLSNRLCEKNQD